MEVCPDVGRFSLPSYGLLAIFTPQAQVATTMTKVLVWNDAPLRVDDLFQDPGQALDVLNDALTRRCVLPGKDEAVPELVWGPQTSSPQCRP